VSFHGGRGGDVAQQTNLPPRKTPGNKNLDQLVGLIKNGVKGVCALINADWAANNPTPSVTP
jgi:hypothetical protein